MQAQLPGWVVFRKREIQHRIRPLSNRRFHTPHRPCLT